MPKLYEITTEYDKLLGAIADNDGEVSDHLGASLDEVQGEFDEKIINIAKMIKNLEGDALAYTDEANRLVKKAQTIINNIKWLKNYIKEGMRRLKTQEVKGEILTVKIRPSPPSCIVLDIDTIPSEYTRTIPEHKEADRKKIILYYKDRAEIVPGTEISVGTTLTIR